MTGKVLVMNEIDNVGMVLQATHKDDELELVLHGKVVGTLVARDEIDIYHKLALKEIHPDEIIYKYGERIGRATTGIYAGNHVHVFNVRSVKV